MPYADNYPHMTETVADRLKALIEQRGMTPRAVSLAASMSQDAVRGILRHPDSSPAIETVQKLARALDCSPEWLAFGTHIYPYSEPPLAELQIVGEVAAGLWTDLSEFSFSPIFYPVQMDPRFPSKAQYLLRVRGNSINRKAPDGSLIRCVSIFAAQRPPQDQDWVVVRRKRSDGNIETTVKRLRVDRANRQALWPDSDDPAFQNPIFLDGAEDDEIEIIAFVIDFINPATRL